jgi:hypothetical protein
MQNNKLIFLDIDGVLNCDTTKEIIVVNGIRYTGIDPRLVAKLNSIIRQNDVRNIVISSSWRKRWTYKQMEKMLKDAGLAQRVTVISQTPLLSTDFSVPRYEEIESWLRMSRNEYMYLIIDDHQDAEIKDHFLLTESHFGLIDQDVHIAKEIFDYLEEEYI